MQQLGQHVESTGWDGIWLADHFMPNAEDTSAPWPEAWVTLSALAMAIPRIRLGTLVTGNTYRHPAVLAKMAATLDHISGGRVVLGIGSPIALADVLGRRQGVPALTPVVPLFGVQQSLFIVVVLCCFPLFFTE